MSYTHAALILVGPHCAGKSALSAELSARHGWALSPGLLSQSPAQALKDETARDDTSADCIHRVIESWHIGNAASCAEDGALQDRAAAAVRAYVKRGALVLVQPLLCSVDAVRSRRAVGAASRAPLEEGEEAALVEASQRAGASATAIAAGIGLTVLPAIDTEKADLGTAADLIYAAVLEHALPPPRVSSIPNLCSSLSEAAAIMRCTLSLDARLYSTPALATDFRALDAFLAETTARETAEARDAQCAPALASGLAVVVEGLDGCGKSTLVAGLAGALNARIASSPTPSFERLRTAFKTARQPARVHRAFFLLGNYAAARELAGETAPVVMDRYFASTISGTLATAVDSPDAVATLPAHLFQWPSDLPTPALCIVLTLDDEKRFARLKARGHGWGVNEAAQAADMSLPRRMAEVRKRITGARMVFIDASPSPAGVLEAALAVCAKAGIARAPGPWAPPRSLPSLVGVDPLCELINNELGRGMCDRLGWRAGPWTMALATAGADARSPPTLRRVGVIRASEAGLVFISQSVPGGGRGGGSLVDATPASATLQTGGAPLEESWRFEGVAVALSDVPIEYAPPALLAAMLARAEPSAYGNVAEAAAALKRGAIREQDLLAAGITAYILQPVSAACSYGGACTLEGSESVHWRRVSVSAPWSRGEIVRAGL